MDSRHPGKESDGAVAVAIVALLLGMRFAKSQLTLVNSGHTLNEIGDSAPALGGVGTGV